MQSQSITLFAPIGAGRRFIPDRRTEDFPKQAQQKSTTAFLRLKEQDRQLQKADAKLTSTGKA